MRTATARRAIRIAVVSTMTALLVASIPVQATGRGEEFDREAVIERAKTWTTEGVPYSQLGYKDGYRRDCSGFLSMAWDLPDNLTTWRVPLVAKEIKKSELLPGDVLLDATSGPGGRHVVIFEKWADSAKTKYWVLESTGQDGVERAVRRVVPYPYRVNKGRYKPYRFVSMDGYWEKMPAGHLQPVVGYRGPVETPMEVLQAIVQDAEQKMVAARNAEKPSAEIEGKALIVKIEAERRISAQRKAEEAREADLRAKAAQLEAEADLFIERVKAETRSRIAEADAAAERFKSAWAEADRRRASRIQAEREEREAEHAAASSEATPAAVPVVSVTATATPSASESTPTISAFFMPSETSTPTAEHERWRLLSSYDSRRASGAGMPLLQR